jgi:Ankyrin repeat
MADEKPKKSPSSFYGSSFMPRNFCDRIILFIGTTVSITLLVFIWWSLLENIFAFGSLALFLLTIFLVLPMTVVLPLLGLDMIKGAFLRIPPPLHRLANKDDLTGAQTLISTDAIKSRDHHGNTALHVAAYRGNSHFISALLRAGCEVDAINDRGETPFQLLMASKSGSREATMALLAAAPEAPWWWTLSCAGCHKVYRLEVDQETECTSFPYWIGIFQGIEYVDFMGQPVYLGHVKTMRRDHFVWFPRDPVKICVRCQSNFGRRKKTVEKRVMLLAAERVMRGEFADGTKVKCWERLSGDRSYAIGDVIVFSPLQAATAMGHLLFGVEAFFRGLFLQPVCDEEEAVALWANANAESQRHTGTPGTIRLNDRYNFVPETKNKGIVAWYVNDTRARAAPGTEERTKA